MIAATLCAVRPALAHDFWIQPSLFRAKPGELINVHLRVGHAFEGEAVARHAPRIEQFIVAGPDQDKDAAGIPGVEGSDPAGFVRPQRQGIYVLGYRSRHARSELEAAKFESYLREQGLERIAELRAQRGEVGQPGRELYSRCAKSIVRVGDDTHASGCDPALEFRLELFPPADLFTRTPGSTFSFQLLFDGRPMEGVLVHACSRSDPHQEIRSRTDENGRVSLVLNHDGAWLLNAVHMFDAPPESGAAWESLWASLTFELPAPASR